MIKKVLVSTAGAAVIAMIAIAVWAFTNTAGAAGIMVDDETPPRQTYTPSSNNDEYADYAEECPIAFRGDMGLDADMMRNQSRAITTADYIYDMFPGTGWPPNYPDYFGGLYLNNEGNLVVLIVKSLAESDEAAYFLTRVENAGGAIIRHVEFSMSELQGIQDTLMYYFAPDHPVSSMIRGSGVDTKANRVNVYILSHDENDMSLFRCEIANSPAVVFHNMREAEKSPSPPLRIHSLLEDTTMAVTYMDRDNGKVVVTISNESPYVVMTGYPFSLEVYDNGWWVVPGDFMFILPAFEIRPGGTLDFTKNLEHHVGNLAPGLYRIRKDVFRDADIPINDGNIHDVVAEFNWE